jgi:hypothetical protein
LAIRLACFALADAALADAQIACWESKYFYNFWRPITAIRLGDQDDNPATDVDSDWKPLINTPNFPEYPSGHATVSKRLSKLVKTPRSRYVPVGRNFRCESVLSVSIFQ